MTNSVVLGSGLALGLRTPASPGAPGLSFEEYRQLDATALAELVRTRQVSAAELLELAIARTEQVNPALNAVVLKHYDLARQAVRNGIPDGPFRGVPFLLKDMGVSMADTITTEGSMFFRDSRREVDDPYIQRARAAGLVIFGKTNSPELGSSASSENRLFGATHNPWNIRHSAGGSSGGTAAAVAAGILPVAHATDGGGSIRIPASSCGLFGLKPSTGLVPLGPAGSDPSSGVLAQHVVSRSVRDSAALLDAVAWKEPGAQLSRQAGQGSYLEQLQRAPGRLRIALMKNPLLPIPVAAACTSAVEQAARQCAALGHEVVEARPELDPMAGLQAGKVFTAIGVLERVATREKQLGRAVRADELEAVNLELLEAARRITAEQIRNAQEVLLKVRHQMAVFMRDYDLILSPSVAAEPPLLGVLDLSLPAKEFGAVAAPYSAFTRLFNVTGQPAMSVPLFWSDSGLPVGVMFAGRFGEERTLIRLAAQLEQAHPWFNRLPSV